MSDKINLEVTIKIGDGKIVLVLSDEALLKLHTATQVALHRAEKDSHADWCIGDKGPCNCRPFAVQE